VARAREIASQMTSAADSAARAADLLEDAARRKPVSSSAMGQSQ